MLFKSSVAAAFLGLVDMTLARVALIDPNTRYSNMTLTVPEYKEPVLQTDWETPPDCGETSYKGSGRLSGLKALITGGDSGIGRAITIAYLREGAHVAINYLPDEEPDVDDLARVLEPEGLGFERIPGNLVNETFCTELVDEAYKRLGGLDILINHAGISGFISGPRFRPIERMDTDELDLVFKTNVYASFWTSRAAIPYLPAGGSILFTTSDLAVRPSNQSIVYSATKATISHMVAALALQLQPRGIRVNGVAPPIAYTAHLPAGGFSTADMRAVEQTVPFGRVAQPAELSPLYVDLAEPSKTFVSGEIFSGNGANGGQ